MTQTPLRPALLENRDYTVREHDGAWIFTREYLLARGTCCGSMCTNCPYGNSRLNPSLENMRPVISFIPSWTETLIAAGAHVVGRTRFCIHPKDAVSGIRVFGGTKTFAVDALQKFEEVRAKWPKRKPLVVLDREENPKEFFEFFEKLDCDIVVTHVVDFPSLITGFETLGQAFVHGSNVAPDDMSVARQFAGFSKRLGQLVTESPRGNVGFSRDSGNSTAFERTVLKSTVDPTVLRKLILETDVPILYFIWRDPWMVVSIDTWIGETFKRACAKVSVRGDERRLFVGDFHRGNAKYPTLEETEIPEGAILLFSSEPYPFLREWDGEKSLLKRPFASKAKALAVVDGEPFSWFGIRSIRFLEEL